MNIQALVSPKSIALVGANEKMGFGGHAARNLVNFRGNCRFYFVNPKYSELLGEKCYPSLKDLPETVDCVELAIPKQGVAEQLELAGSLGIQAAVVFASGYTEEHTEEGKRLNDELVGIAQRYDMAILGPNCMGLLNIGDKVNAMGLPIPTDFMEREPRVAVLSHSGALSHGIAERGGFPLGYQISVGNGAVTTMEDFMEYFIEDDRTKVLALYLEGLKKPRLFLECLKRAAEKRKPIVLLKTGRSEIAAKSAASHTGSLAGSFRSYEAVFEKYGVVSVNNLEELAVTANMLAILHDNMPKGTKVAGLNLSGGANVLMAEAAHAANVEFAEFDEATVNKIKPYIPSFSTVSNPLDSTTDLFYKPENISCIVNAMSECEDVGYIVAGENVGAEESASIRTFVTGLANARKEHAQCKPVMLVNLTEKDRRVEYRRILSDAGIPLLSSMVPSFQSIACLNKLIGYKPEKHSLAIPDRLYDSGKETVALSESESKEILSQIGIPVPREVLIDERKQIAQIRSLQFPLVAKISSPDILHKSNVGGVKVNIETMQDAESAYEEILMNCKSKCPTAKIDGVVFQEMAPKGQEFIVGVSNDPQLGPMVMVGMGGIFVEVFKDVQLMPAPLSKAEAADMLERLQSAPLLHGYRGSEELDVEALAEIVSKISIYAFENSGTLKEMDVNPVIVYPKGKGAIAVDGLIIRNR